MHDDEPKPKRRSRPNHAFSAFMLLVCLGWSAWLIDQAGWTNWGEWWKQTRIHFVGAEAFRAEVKPGMSRSSVYHQVGPGQEVVLSQSSMAEDYPRYNGRVVYRLPNLFEGYDWVVERVEHLP